MQCLSLALTHFRSHERSKCTFAPRITLLHGPNGSGKTNVLEALHQLTLGRSFITHNDGLCIQQGQKAFQIEGMFAEGERTPFTMRMVYQTGQGKSAWINGSPAESLSKLIGIVPIVAMTPQDQQLTAGAPEDRRRFLNMLLSQAQALYLEDLIRFNRALKQRNELLAGAKKQPRKLIVDVFDAWTEEFVVLGARIIQARWVAVQDFKQHLEQAFHRLKAEIERPHITYDTVVGTHDVPLHDIESALRTQLREKRSNEIDLGYSLVGPHRDDLVFTLDDREVRRFASQGQHRTFSIALRLAHWSYLRDRLEQKPILLLDDVLGHVDQHRTKLLADVLLADESGQVIITHPDENDLMNLIPWHDAQHARVALASCRIDPNSL